jgi:uncharacterized protein (DUF433 family)
MDLSTITPVSIDHIALDGKGRPFFVKHPRMRLEFLIGHLRDESGDAVADIREGWDFLTLGEIYAAMSYYADHQAEVDAQIERTNAEIEMMRAALEVRNADFQTRFQRLKAEQQIDVNAVISGE